MELSGSFEPRWPMTYNFLGYLATLTSIKFNKKNTDSLKFDEFVLFLSAFIHINLIYNYQNTQNSPAKKFPRKMTTPDRHQRSKPRSIGISWDSNSPSFICKEGRQQTIYIAGWFAGLTFHIPKDGGCRHGKSWRRCLLHTRDDRVTNPYPPQKNKRLFFLVADFISKAGNGFSDL